MRQAFAIKLNQNQKIKTVGDMDQRALITGGGRGIGRAVALAALVSGALGGCGGGGDDAGPTGPTAAERYPQAAAQDFPAVLAFDVQALDMGEMGAE